MTGPDYTWQKLKTHIDKTSEQPDLDIMLCFVAFCMQQENENERWKRLRKNFMKEYFPHIKYLFRQIPGAPSFYPLQVNDPEALAKKIAEIYKEGIVELPPQKKTVKNLCRWITHCFSSNYNFSKMYLRILHYREQLKK